MTGSMVSSTVTVAVQVAGFPLPSSAVRVTVLAPRSAQSKVNGITLSRLTVPQLSEELAASYTSAGAMVALPLASSATVWFWQTNVGGVLSAMVTVVLQKDWLPLLSVTKRNTVFVPMSEQSKLAGATIRLAMPQASPDPASTSAGITIAMPLLSR